MGNANIHNSSEKKANGFHNSEDGDSNNSWETVGQPKSDDFLISSHGESNDCGYASARTEDLKSNTGEDDDSRSDLPEIFEDIGFNGNSPGEEVEGFKAANTVRFLTTEDIESITNDKKKAENGSPSSQRSNASSMGSIVNRKRRVLGKNVYGNLNLDDDDESDCGIRVKAEQCIGLRSKSVRATETTKDIAVKEEIEEKWTPKPFQLTTTTKRAIKLEFDRLAQIIDVKCEGGDDGGMVKEVVLDHDTKKNTKIIVHKAIVEKLKQHQIDGIKLMYDSCYGKVDKSKRFDGSGCILAHCMGLGKTLQVSQEKHTNS